MNLRALGYVRSDDRGFYLEINEDYVDGLKELTDFSHINILWWANLFAEDEYREIKVVKKPYKNGPEEMGILATRSPIRPNPIMLSVAYVISIEGNKIRIPFIDAENGTEILDLKPYYPCSDKVRDVSVPSWCAHWPSCIEESADFAWEKEFENAR